MKVLTNLTIKSRLLTNAAVVAAGLTLLFALMVINSNTMKDLGHKLSKVEKLHTQVLELRRNEKDFIARKELKYHDSFQKNFKTLQANIEEIKLLTSEYDMQIPELADFSGAANEYNQKFSVLVDYQKVIGLTPTDGLYGELRASVHTVEEILKQHSSYRLLADMLQLRRAEKDFMLRRDVKYLTKFEDGINNFYADLDMSDKSDSVKNSIRSALTEYKAKFTQLVKAEQKVGLSKGEGLLGELRTTIQATEFKLAAMLKVVEEKIEQEMDFALTIAVLAFLGAMTFTLVVVYSTSQSILKPILAVRNAISHIRENNDLTWLVKSKGKDELVELGDDVNSLVADFRNLIGNVNTALRTLDSATEELAANANETLDGMEQQFSESDMVATSGAEMQATVSDINQNTQLATSTALKTDELAKNGSQEVRLTSDNINELATQLQNALTQIEKLESDSQAIGTVSDAIRGIAEQTNLLALNAAIEAARAGEQGRGFAVVADEVRSLAMRTQESTSEIESIITSLQSSTQTIVGVVNQCYKNGLECSEQATRAGESLEHISSHVNEVVEMNTQISASLQEQDQVATEMSKHVIRIRDIASESQQKAATNAETSSDIAKQAAILHSETERFKV